MKLVLLGVVAYLLFLLTQLPVTHVLAKLEPLPRQMQIYGAEGTLFAGRAALVQQKPWRLEQVTWELRPWALLSGKLEFTITFHNADENNGSARIGMTLLRQPYLADLRTHLRLNTFEALWQPALLNVAGWVNTELNYLDWSPAGLYLQGQITLENITVNDTPPMPLGDFLVILDTNENNDFAKDQANLEENSERRINKNSNRAKTKINAEPPTAWSRIVHGQISDRGGPMQVQGQLQLTSGGDWHISGTLTPRANTPAKIRQALAFLGQPDDKGRFPLALNGHISLPQ